MEEEGTPCDRPNPGPQPACVTEESRACVFPFTFRGREHKACTRAHSVNGAPWCATLSSAGEAVRWGDCTPGCPVEGGGSTLGLCTGRCGAPGPQVPHPRHPATSSCPLPPPPA